MITERTKENIQLYLEEKVAIAQPGNFPVDEVAQLFDRVIETYEREKVIYVFGNGGNAAVAENLVNDWRFLPFVSDDKSRPMSSSIKRLNISNLAVSPATISGVLNDFSGEQIFSAQLEGIVKKEDLVIGLSGSGNSKNILRAIEVAKTADASTVGITRGDGGQLRSLCDLCIIIPGNSRFPGQVGGNNNNFHYEDFSTSIAHMISGLMQQYIREKYVRNSNS